MKPLIGIPAHPTLQERNHTIIHSCGENYLKSVEKAGGVPLILPIFDTPEAVERYAAMCDGFIIPGGIDVNPLSYGEEPHPLLQMTRLASAAASRSSTLLSAEPSGRMYPCGRNRPGATSRRKWIRVPSATKC